MMDIREIARAFDMTVTELAERVGCSREALYARKLKNPRRAAAAVEHLKTINQLMYMNDQTEALRRRTDRDEAIESFKLMFLKGGAHET